MLVSKSVTLSDMESVDTEFYNSVKYILENDPEPLCLTFTASREFLGQVRLDIRYMYVHVMLHDVTMETIQLLLTTSRVKNVYSDQRPPTSHVLIDPCREVSSVSVKIHNCSHFGTCQ